ncbi:MAG: hypothetical protein HY720_01735 [Planctomycetes bacterium]|nr:hypothetical protein [Planctomycetota bacterium]
MMRGTLLVSLLFLAATGLARADEGTPPDKVEVRFEDLPLEAFLEWTMKVADPPVRLTYKPEVRQVQIQVLSPRPIDRKDVLEFARFILKMHGFVLVPFGKDESWETYEVIRDTQGRWEPFQEVSLEELSSRGDAEMVTCVLPLRHASAKEVQGALKLARISHPNVGNIVGIESTNTLVISDYACLVRELVRMVEGMDAAEPLHSVSVEIGLFPGEAFPGAPRAATGEKAQEVARQARRDTAAALLAASWGYLAFPGEPGQRFETPCGPHRLILASGLGVPTTAAPGVTLSQTRWLNLDVEILYSGEGEAAAEKTSTSLAVPAGQPGIYSFVHSVRSGDRVATLVVLVEVEVGR